MKVRVTKRLIAEGVQHNVVWCPVARALAERLGGAQVCSENTLARDNAIYTHRKPLTKWIDTYDAKGPSAVKPITPLVDTKKRTITLERN